MTEKIAFGVAGWSYPDWRGFVYPPGTRDELQYLAEYVDLIEINSTFYRPPDERNTSSWARRTQHLPGFYFTAKLHQDVTHGGRIEDAMVRAFHEGMRPLTDAGRLRHLLAQFRHDFADGDASRAHLRAVRERFGDAVGLVLELRHGSWQTPGALDFLGSLDVTVANLDYPTGRDSFTLQECRIGTDGYLRLHGRNAKAWFDRNAGRDQTYNYAYSNAELERIRNRAVSLARTYRSLTIVANNHYEGKEVANALQLKALLAGARVKVPPLLAQRYPPLREIAARAVHGSETGELF
jgi:uncharacterized protein YecE (DUF72 family)